jgi:hypothetical protein
MTIMFILPANDLIILFTLQHLQNAKNCTRTWSTQNIESKWQFTQELFIKLQFGSIVKINTDIIYAFNSLYFFELSLN